MWSDQSIAIVRIGREEDGRMRISIQTDESVSELTIAITCKQLTPELEKVIETLRMLEHKISAVREGETYLLDVSKVLYMETVDKRTFIYTENEVYETNLKLYELEERLAEAHFFRASKSSIINLKRIQSLKADIDRRIRVTMENGEQVIVSRQYSEMLKQRLGVK